MLCRKIQMLEKKEKKSLDKLHHDDDWRQDSKFLNIYLDALNFKKKILIICTQSNCLTDVETSFFID